MAKIRKIYDQTIKPDGSKTTIYPITSTRAVFAPDGTCLDKVLANLHVDLPYIALDSTSDLPPEENHNGYLIGENLYVWVGAGGDTLDGKYQNCGPFKGPRGTVLQPDNEDIIGTEANTLQFADRDNVEGMGYKILRRNKSFKQQVDTNLAGTTNTIYEIRYDFDLRESFEGLELISEFDYGGIIYYSNEEPIAIKANQTIWIPDDCVVVNEDRDTLLSINSSYMPTADENVYIACTESKTIGYVLSGIVTIPAGCVLKFVGGSISNGTIDLNSDCEIIGSGIKCLIANPSVKPMPLSCYLADVSDTQRNNAVVQTLLDAGVAIFDDIPAIEFANYLSVKGTIHFEGVGKRKAVRFPQSRGFVWDTIADSNRNYFAFLAISANGDAFDFINGGDANRAKNVYFSTFRELTVISTNGDCFSAGVDNKGATGDNCFFDNQFDSIYVIAPNGSGFKGLNSNTILFIKVRSGSCGVSVFYNCAGHIESFNGTWDTTTTFYKGTPLSNGTPVRYRLILDNCNIESFKGILFDCNNLKVYMHCIFRQCSFYINGNNGVIDFHPFNFYYLYQLVWRNNLVNLNGSFDNDHCLFYVNRLIDMNYDVDSAILCDTQNSSSYRTTLTADSATQRNGLLSTQFANQSYKRIGKIESDIIRPKCVMPTFNVIKFNEAPPNYISRNLLTAGGILYHYYLIAFDSSIDTEGSSSTFNNIYPDGGNYTNNETMLRFPAWSFMLENAAINRTISFTHNYSSGGRFICSTGSAIKLNPGQCAKITLFRPSGSSLDYYYVEPVSQNPNAGSSRPTDNLFVGFQFFDKALSPARPIWWTGTDWVDATGTTV